MRILAAAFAAAAVLAPTALADAPDARTHVDFDSTRTITVVRLPGRPPLGGHLHHLGLLRRERQPRPPAPPRRAGVHGHVVEPGERQVDLVRARRTRLQRVGRRRHQTQTVAGRERLFIARGEGPVASQVGRIVFVVAPDGSETIPFVAGPWDLDITPELCAYLA